MASVTIKMFDERILRGIPPGTWVAISQSQEHVVATGGSLEEILLQARKKGEELPFVIRIPEENLAVL